MSTELTVFNEFETGLVLLEESNASKEFPDTPEGLADRRAWYKKLRKGTNALAKIRKEAGADYLRLKREVDSEAGTIQVRLDVMEMPHKIILDAEDAKVQKEIDALAAKAEAEKVEKEAKRIAEFEAKEKKLNDAIEKLEKAEKALEDKKLAEEAEVKLKKELAEATAKAALEAEAKLKQAVIDGVAKSKREAEEKAAAIVKAATDKETKENAEKEVADKKEATRVANVEHREDVEYQAEQAILGFAASMSPPDARTIIEAIRDGEISTLSLTY